MTIVRASSVKLSMGDSVVVQINVFEDDSYLNGKVKLQNYRRVTGTVVVPINYARQVSQVNLNLGCV